MREFFLKLQGWNRKRRFVVVQSLSANRGQPLGVCLWKCPDTRSGFFVTNRSGDSMELWRDNNQRAVIEQRIEEIKAEMPADGFCMRDFYAAESAFLAFLFTFYLPSLCQKIV